MHFGNIAILPEKIQRRNYADFDRIYPVFIFLNAVEFLLFHVIRTSLINSYLCNPKLIAKKHV